ncbi:MAG: hypothetical protein F6K36_12985 [Symploca sp. SIO3C6]|nr:hypothetical protein [Symploca sp. SIO3C6]NET04247.1 hypothetical protein [Symploca sp. SIO2B6]
MKNQNLPDLIANLFEFMENSGVNAIDFHMVYRGNEKLCSLLSPKISRYFIPIGEHSSRSLICYWKHIDDAPLDKLPLVWLDSEGTPNSVFASNEHDFLSLLPYDLGGIYDFISSWESYHEQPDNYTYPLEKYDSSALGCLIEICQEDNPDYTLFVQWLNQSLGIKICENPAKLVGDAISRFPRLKPWLEKKGVR